jgi:hypothetical protein
LVEGFLCVGLRRFDEVGVALRPLVVGMNTMDKKRRKKPWDRDFFPDAKRRDLARLRSSSNINVEIAHRGRSLLRYKTRLSRVSGTNIVVDLCPRGIGGSRGPWLTKKSWCIGAMLYPDVKIDVVSEVDFISVEVKVLLDGIVGKWVFVPDGNDLPDIGWKGDFTSFIDQSGRTLGVTLEVWPVLRLPNSLETPRGKVSYSFEAVKGGEISVQTAHLKGGVEDFTEIGGPHYLISTP